MMAMGEGTLDRKWGLSLQRRQRALQGANRLFARVYHHVDVRSPNPLPAKGPAILVCNHTSGLDPQLIQGCCNRLITWLMAHEYYDLPFIKAVLSTVGVIPLKRGARDIGATRAALRALEAGQILGIFPEGKIETDGEILPFQTGVGLLALKSQAPVYPAYLDGTQHGLEMKEAFLRRQRAVLIFGQPLRFTEQPAANGAVEHVTKLIEQAVTDLRESIHKS
jgi:1-acyl-sn-glycerol-3-phosphate acyltransferase